MKMLISRVTVFLILSTLLVFIPSLSSTTLASPSDTEANVVRQHANTTPAPDNAILADETGLPLEVFIPSLSSTTLASPSDTEANVVRQHANTNPTPDNVILAEQTGLPLEQIDKAVAFQEAFAKYAGELISRFPDQISGVWADSPPGAIGPSTRGHIRFTGDVPPGLASMENVSLTGGGMISMGDHKRRSELAAKALSDLGYQNFVTFSDFIDQLIHIELKLPEGASQPSKSDIVAAVQKRVQADPELQGRAATVDAADLELTVFTGSGPIVTDLHSRGGN